MFKLRADRSDNSTSLIVNFHSKWKDQLESGQCAVFFRKFGPQHFAPRYVYTYVASPVSAITTRLEISKYERLPLCEALALAERGMLTEDELRSYAVNYRNLVVFTVSATHVAANPLSLAHLSQAYGFWPDSTSIPLTTEGAALLDEEAQFTPIADKHSEG